MFGFDPVVLAIVALAAIAAGAVCYGLLFTRMETEKKSANRVNRVASAEADKAGVKAARDRVQEMSKRRKCRTRSRISEASRIPTRPGQGGW